MHQIGDSETVSGHCKERPFSDTYNRMGMKGTTMTMYNTCIEITGKYLTNEQLVIHLELISA